jgi:protein-tyrosine phosphatase
VIDLHCHALPGIDDGAPDLAGTIAMARVAEDAGTTMLVATPHIDPWWAVDPVTLSWRAQECRTVLAEAGVAIELRTGGEIALSRLPDLHERELDLLALGGGGHVLLEAPLIPGTGDLEALLLGVLERGRGVLLAHPERCPELLRDPARYERLLAAGVLGQFTAGSFSGQFGGTVQRAARRWLDDGWVHVVASDAHDPYRRSPDLRGPLVRAGLDDELIAWLTEAVPAAIVAAEPIPERPGGALRPRA